MKKSNLNVKAKHGDQVGVLCYIRPLHLTDYIRFFILFFINFKYITTLQWGRICWYHHIASLVEEDGVLYVYEAVSPVYRNSGPWEEYKRSKSIKAFLLLRPNFNFDPETVTRAANTMVGKPYDYWGTCFLQLFYNLSFESVWLGTRNILKALKKVYCSEAGANICYEASEGRYFKEPYKASPMTLIEREVLDHIIE